MAERGVVILVALTSCASLDGSRPMSGPTGSAESPPMPVSEPSPAPREPFVPTARIQGGDAVLSVVFPDGAEAELRYPSDVDLAGMGIQPAVSLVWMNRYVWPINFSYGGRDDRILGAPTGESYDAANGVRLELWTADDSGPRLAVPPPTHWLVASLPLWTVHVPVPRDVDPGDLAPTLALGEAEYGFPVIETSAPADLPEGYGEARGPQLSFGDLEPLDSVRPGEDGLLVDVAPSRCRGSERTVSGDHGSACLAEGRLFLNATSFSGTEKSRALLRRIVSSVEATVVAGS